VLPLTFWMSSCTTSCQSSDSKTQVFLSYSSVWAFQYLTMHRPKWHREFFMPWLLLLRVSHLDSRNAKLLRVPGHLTPGDCPSRGFMPLCLRHLFFFLPEYCSAWLNVSSCRTHFEHHFLREAFPALVHAATLGSNITLSFLSLPH
jgi:hypothetical protein